MKINRKHEAEVACAEVLRESFAVPEQQVDSHQLMATVRSLIARWRRVRMIHPFIYAGVGITLILILLAVDAPGNADWAKLFGAVIAVFSALLAFSRPSVELTQADCERHLAGQRMAASDLAHINKRLNLHLHPEQLENRLKLISSLASLQRSIY